MVPKGAGQLRCRKGASALTPDCLIVTGQPEFCGAADDYSVREEVIEQKKRASSGSTSSDLPAKKIRGPPEEPPSPLHEACPQVFEDGESARVAKDEEHLALQTQVLFRHFLGSHCCPVPERVRTPTWLLTRLFQCHCVSAGVPMDEVADCVVADYIGKCCREKYKCTVVKKVTYVMGLVVYSNSPLHNLWKRKALAPKINGGERKCLFSKCIIVHPRDAMGGVKKFSTDARRVTTTTGRFVSKSVVKREQGRYSDDQRELNKLEFGHVMCKGNRGIDNWRPQSRIMPPMNKDKQEYHYSSVARRVAPLLTRDTLCAAITQRGLALQHHERHHLMKHAQLHTSYYSGKLHDGCH